MKSGCYTALITPFADDAVDYTGLEKLMAFQEVNGITGILAVGTTGESPTLNWHEHNRVIEAVVTHAKGKYISIAGTGSNNTRESFKGTEHAARIGADAVLLVDPYYNGPSSLEIRKEYISPIAAAFPDLEIIPYVIPGRTGTQLLPEDLAILFSEHPNVRAVKEATNDMDAMRRTRACCGPDYTILSGDDGNTMAMMTDPEIKAAGVISVISNIVPKSVTEMVMLLDRGNIEKAAELNKALAPLFDLVTVKTMETTPYGDTICRARNPLPIKSLMAVLGMPAGPCRRPLGKMTKNAMKLLLDTVRGVHEKNPEILQPVSDFFGVNIEERLTDPVYRESFCY
ncbi:MAG: 4-hydroxy-tetrahydrodipicolinate synthase [Desulfobacterales bacterium]